MGIKKRIHEVINSLKKPTNVSIEIPAADSKLLEGKVALISGGNGGIGFAIAKELQACGCRIVIGGTNQKKLDNCQKNLGGGVHKQSY